MRYSQMRQVAHTGDVLLVEGQGWVSRLIRMLTGQNISHVAVLVWIGNALWVAEMKEFFGYRLRPASLWVEDTLPGAVVYYGEAPVVVQMAGGDMDAHDVIFFYRNRRYSYRSLVRVWWAQVRRKKIESGLVCSTFVQKVWEASGMTFKQTADPGDYMRLCQMTMPLRRM